MRKIKELQQLACSMIGDSKRDHLYFVSVEGVILMIVRDLTPAYRYWNQLRFEHPNTEVDLEDRCVGVLSSQEWDEEKRRWVVFDDCDDQGDRIVYRR